MLRPNYINIEMKKNYGQNFPFLFFLNPKQHGQGNCLENCYKNHQNYEIP